MRQRRRFRLTFHYFNHTRDRTGGGLSYSITPQVHKILNFPGTCPLKCALKGNNNPPPLHNLTISLTCCKSYSTAGWGDSEKVHSHVIALRAKLITTFAMSPSKMKGNSNQRPTTSLSSVNYSN